VDVRILATLAKFYEQQNYPIENRSRLVSQALSDLVDHLVKLDLIVKSTDVEQSLSYLNRMGFGVGRRRPGKSIWKHMAKADQRKEVDTTVVPKDVMDEVLDKIEEVRKNANY